MDVYAKKHRGIKTKKVEQRGLQKRMTQTEANENKMDPGEKKLERKLSIHFNN